MININLQSQEAQKLHAEQREIYIWKHHSQNA